jgi:triosephosphate isomerase
MTTRVPLIAGNWKMFKTSSEAVDTAKELVRLVADITDVDIMIAPAFTALDPVSNILQGSRVALGAQNLHWESEGAYTGEVSAAMLKSAGCSHVIIGHSERRQFFGETDVTVNKRLRAAIGAKLISVVCVGETADEREAAQTFSVLDKQIRMGLKGILAEDMHTLIIAYEPVWAIGTGKTATSDQAQEAHGHIRSLIDQIGGRDLSQSIRILYGGSVKPDNIASLMQMPDIDGALVGGASLKAESFSRIIHYQ